MALSRSGVRLPYSPPVSLLMRPTRSWAIQARHARRHAAGRSPRGLPARLRSRKRMQPPSFAHDAVQFPRRMTSRPIAPSSSHPQHRGRPVRISDAGYSRLYRLHLPRPRLAVAGCRATRAAFLASLHTGQPTTQVRLVAEDRGLDHHRAESRTTAEPSPVEWNGVVSNRTRSQCALPSCRCVTRGTAPRTSLRPGLGRPRHRSR